MTVTEEEGAWPRVAAGAIWLDGVRPGWHDNVDMATLDMDDAERCVAGQVFGDYRETPVPATMGVGTASRIEWTQRHGFLSSPYASHSDLRRTWVAEIEGRQAVTS